MLAYNAVKTGFLSFLGFVLPNQTGGCVSLIWVRSAKYMSFGIDGFILTSADSIKRPYGKLTSSLLEVMNEDEIVAIVGHEVMHIKSRDTLLLAITVALNFAVAAIIAPVFIIGFFVGGRREILLVIFASTILAAATTLSILLSWSREYAADVGSAKICERPDWLVSALLKLNATRPLRRLPGLGRIGFSAPFYAFAYLHLRSFCSNSHPSIEGRVQRLKMLSI